MRNLLNPKWLLIINTLPVTVLLSLFYGEFEVIKSLLNEDNLRLWKAFGITLATLGILNLIYTVFAIIRKRSVSLIYAAIALLCYIPFIYLYGFNVDNVIPFSIPRWMLNGEMILHVGTFLMPTLAYSMFVLVIHFTPGKEEQSAGKSVAWAIFIPIILYFFVQVILPLWQPVNDNFKVHAFLIIMIIASLLFLFFIIRSVYILVSRKTEHVKRYQLVWKVPISIIFPLLGLIVNNSMMLNDFTYESAGVFGDFHTFWFYALALLNGLFLCLPDRDHKIYRFFLFIARCTTFTYTLYFFLVFLPFLPLSVFAIVLVGLGFLMLTPIVLFILHLSVLSNDYHYLKRDFSNRFLLAMSLIGIMMIPILTTFEFLQDRKTLHVSLDYIYNPDYSIEYNIDRASLKNTLSLIKEHKSRGAFMNILEDQQPYLSSFFKWLVMDNLTLSNLKISKIEKVFFGEPSEAFRTRVDRTDHVSISDFQTNSIYDPDQDVWKSWINIELTNHGEFGRLAEYATTIDLPIGAWISDYYLFVGERKEMGILAEKKSAMWVYSNIRNENRDPGILYYLSGNKVAFRVFPFSKNEVRKTGIELLHKGPIELTIDDRVVALGNNEISQGTGIENEHVIYVSTDEKKSLKEVKRKPYFHFIIDCTNEKKLADYRENIERLTEEYPQFTENANISLVNTYVQTSSYNNNDWDTLLKDQLYEGGFFLDRALKSMYFSAYQSSSDVYPVPIVVTDTLENAILENDFADWHFTMPQKAFYYHLGETGEFEAHALLSDEPLLDSNPLLLEEVAIEYVLEDGTVRYLPADEEPTIILKNQLLSTGDYEVEEKKWQSALMLQAQSMSQILHPETAASEWLDLVKHSFISKVMTPVTSYLVVENEAQKAILKKKQQQVLSGKKSLDLDDETQQMSEPGLLILGLMLCLILYLRNTRVVSFRSS